MDSVDSGSARAGAVGGAAEYVVKPFSPRELVLRVQAILRREGQETGEGRIVYDPLVIDLERGRPRDAHRRQAREAAAGQAGGDRRLDRDGARPRLPLPPRRLRVPGVTRVSRPAPVPRARLRATPGQAPGGELR
jgi:hypothetical protein